MPRVRPRKPARLPSPTSRMHSTRAATMPWETQQQAFEVNRLFHRAVVEATNNRYLIGFFDNVWGSSNTLRVWAHFYAAQPHTSDDVVTAHIDVLVALRGGSGVAASDVMAEHIRAGYRHHFGLDS